VAAGGLHGLHVTARDPLRFVVREAASTFVLVHNHPSGDPSPSEEDLAFTRAVVEGSVAVGTPLLDHVIVARRQSTSMLEAGVLPFPRAKALGRARAPGSPGS
jgi:DNA repair protein RadC